MTDTLDRFAAGLKQKLREDKDNWYEYSRDTEGGSYYIDWDALGAEIDAFCAEFKAGDSSSPTKAHLFTRICPTCERGYRFYAAGNVRPSCLNCGAIITSPPVPA